MTDTPDATGGGPARPTPVPSTGSGTSAAAQKAEPVGAPETEEAEHTGASQTEEAEPVEASGPSAVREEAEPARQPVVRVRGSRRAQLLAAPGTTAEPAPADDGERGAGPKPVASGPNDDRMLRDVPPHY